MSNPSQSFNLSQTFFIDPSVAADNVSIELTGIDCYFMYKPDAVNNRSGIINPGITLYLTDTIFNVPKITQQTYTQMARAEWSNIITSSDASVPTRFIFKTPVTVKSGQQYAMILSFDGNESFWPHIAKNGMWEVNTRVIYNSASGNFHGSYYEYTNSDPTANPENAVTQNDYKSFWRSLSDTSLKFTVYAARYFVSGTPICANTDPVTTPFIHHGALNQIWDSVPYDLTYLYQGQAAENIAFDINASTVQAFVGAQRVYQDGPFYPGGWAGGSDHITVTTNGSPIIVANTLLPNGSSFSWSNVFGGYQGVKYITVMKADGSITNINKVVSIIDAVTLLTDEPVTWTASDSKFRVSPVATIDSMMSGSPFGKKDHFMFLTHSNANGTVRFVNNCIESVTASVGGTLYKNTDVLYVKGFYDNSSHGVAGGYIAVGNLVTNSTGGIVSVYMSNSGAGFVNTSAVVTIVSNNGTYTANSTTGSGATLTCSVGATLKTELSNNIFKNCIVTNLDINSVTPFFGITVPPGSTYNMGIQTQYYAKADAAVLTQGFAYYIDSTRPTYDISALTTSRFIGSKIPAFVSYSNEFITLFPNGDPTTGAYVNALSQSSNNYIIKINTTSQNDYNVVTVDNTPSFEFDKYIINNDYTYEWSPTTGNAWAKHITTTINLNRLSEDIRLYMDVYRPPNTDLQVYARIHNSADPEAFDDEDFTHLTCISGNTIYSSLQDTSNYVEMGYGFRSQPDTSFTFAGSITTTNNSNVITGLNTTFLGASNVAVGDMVKLYDPLFPNSNFMVAEVAVATSNTSLTLDANVSSNTQLGGNPALVGSGLQLDKMNSHHQGFNNITADNVVRYYNTSMTKYDGYDSMQIKVVMLSSQLGAIPRIHDIRTVAVSA